MHHALAHQLAFYTLTAVFLMAATGYGAVFCRWCFPGHRPDAAFSASVGVAILIFLGGILNALGIAYGVSLDTLLGAGVALLVWHSARTFSRSGFRTHLFARCREAAMEPGLWLTGVAFVFAAIWIVPTAAFNPHDDLVQYLFRPYHMLRFGSVSASWFDSTGADSLGAQSWMQAFFLNHLPANYADAFDRVICFSLACALVVSLGRALGVARGYRFAAVAVLILISPTPVNISAIYSLSMAVLGLTLALLLFARTYFAGRSEIRQWTRALLPSVLFAAALVALKFTTLVFVAAICLMFFVVALMLFRSRRDVIVALLVGSAAGLIALGPWAFTFLPLYSDGGSPAPANVRQNPTWTQMFGYWTEEHRKHALRVRPIQYGQRGLVTTVAVLLMLAAAAFWARWGRTAKGSSSAEAFAIGLVGPSAALSCIVAPALFPWGYLRYSAPLVIAAFPVAVLFALGAARANQSSGAIHRSLSRTAAVSLVLGAVIVMIGLSTKDMSRRVRLALNQRTTMVIAQDTDFHTYVSRLLKGEQESRMRALQQRIPPGKTILAVVITPTLFDLGRNPVHALFMGAMSSPWWGDLGGAKPEQVQALLHKRGVEYVIWQYAGDWVIPVERIEQSGEHPTLARQNRNFLAMYRAFESLRMGTVVYADDEFLVFSIEPNFVGRASLPAYTLGATTNFALGGLFSHGFPGWSARDSSGAWSDGKKPELLFRLDEPPRRDLILVARFRSFVAPEQLPKTVVDVAVNGRQVGQWTITGMEQITRCVDIPRELGRDGELRVSFHVDAPPSPPTPGAGTDTRNLGILLKDVTITVGGDGSTACPQ